MAEGAQSSGEEPQPDPIQRALHRFLTNPPGPLDPYPEPSPEEVAEVERYLASFEPEPETLRDRIEGWWVWVGNRIWYSWWWPLGRVWREEARSRAERTRLRRVWREDPLLRCSVERLLGSALPFLRPCGARAYLAALVIYRDHPQRAAWEALWAIRREQARIIKLFEEDPD